MFKPENKSNREKVKGYFGIGIEDLISEENLGTLWRSAYLLGASFIFTIGKKYKVQNTDTTKSYMNIPMFQYDTFEEFYNSMPKSCKLVGIEIDDKAVNLVNYKHFTSAIYLLGSEGNGLKKTTIEQCHDLVYIPSIGCLNVAATGSIVLYDRILKNER